ncbi:exo-rhamnogalacturonan lyase family protein [Roseimarinus sediminis]|uniref:exo-rhamnogalacturonan lyase family protein n=1 Tax=Roseimarinus sediminis TaxID=1610899 RepID=UPI003D1ED96C
MEQFRRQFQAKLLFLLLLLPLAFVSKAEIPPVQLRWLDSVAPAPGTGVSWGVPFQQGSVQADTEFVLSDRNEKIYPLQYHPLAYWPDGSLKWAGFSTVSDTGTLEQLLLREVTSKQDFQGTKIAIRESEEDLLIYTGPMECLISKSGSRLIKYVKMNGKPIALDGTLLAVLQKGAPSEYGPQADKIKLESKIEKLTLEQHGPVKALVKIEGSHLNTISGEKILPFVVRIYFYAGSVSVKMVHTFVYDADQEQDFVRGIGLVFDVPLDEALYNRHVRFAGDDQGFWDEPVQALTGRMPLSFETDWYERQLKGERIPERDQFSVQQHRLIDNWASWNDFQLQQLSADAFSINKRSNGQSAWISAGWGKRSQGLAWLGDVSGGMAVGMRDFWQSHPSALEVRNARSNEAQLYAWLWSPEAQPMDMRHYDTLAWGHTLHASYEDVQPGFSTANGVARTSELYLYFTSEVPAFDELQQWSRQSNQPALLMASPEYLHSIPVFGHWSLPDTTSKGKRWIEKQLNQAFRFYLNEVEQRHWYGFWDYGDVMHAYDRHRHVWRYDIGGYAWANTELMPNLWLWYQFLRSGDQRAFRMAEAMTRHTGEVDVYHSGPFNGLGSRHNVRHWGCGAKEVRISQAALSRIYYYLTTDERTGDLMEAAVEASNEAIGKTDPLRMILDKGPYPTHARVGPDWLALAGNWMTAWERSGDTIYRNRILKGVESLNKMPYGFFSGKTSAMGYDPSSYELFQLEKEHMGIGHLSVLMGGPEVAYELSQLLNNQNWDELWLQYCKLYGAHTDSVAAEFGRKEQLGDPGIWYARLPAYYAYATGTKSYATRAWKEFLEGSPWGYPTFNTQPIEGANLLQAVDEISNVSTNSTAQWCLNAIQLLELIGDEIPDEHPRFNPPGALDEYIRGALIFRDNFSEASDNWIVESNSDQGKGVLVENGKLVIDVNGGATVWLKQPLSGNVLISFDRKVLMNDGINDRLSDLNMFWMATDPENENLFTRNGVFSQYHGLSLYYAGIGGNYNSTTRFRKYNGKGERILHAELNDEAHLLKANKSYHIEIVVYNGTTKLYVDGNEYFSFTDEEPLSKGWFGFRTVKSHHEIDNVRIDRLK